MASQELRPRDWDWTGLQKVVEDIAEWEHSPHKKDATSKFTQLLCKWRRERFTPIVDKRNEEHEEIKVKGLDSYAPKKEKRERKGSYVHNLH